MSRVDDVLRNMLSLIRRTTSKVKIVEVGPRDGLQNEPKHLSVDTKVSFIEKLVHCGLSHIEVGSFTKLPQMKDTDKVLDRLQRTGTIYSALVPNRKGMDLAAAHKASEVAIFTAASESFTHKNINCSIQESLDRFKPVVSMAAAKGIPVRGYVSCIAQCPYEGKIQPSQVAIVTEALFKMGCHEVSLGDTIGVATPGAIESVLKAVLAIAPVSQLAIHCHDTYGQALANILQSIHVFEADLDGHSNSRCQYRWSGWMSLCTRSHRQCGH